MAAQPAPTSIAPPPTAVSVPPPATAAGTPAQSVATPPAPAAPPRVTRLADALTAAQAREKLCLRVLHVSQIMRSGQQKPTATAALTALRDDLFASTVLAGISTAP